MMLPPRYRLYMRWPRLLGALFLIETPYRLRHELRWSQLRPLLGRPVSFARMARRAAFLDAPDAEADCARITAPTLVVTGERPFDHVVPVDSTREYLKLIPGSSHVRLLKTGHLGAITRPELFRAVVQGYVDTILSGAA
jgi:pimeloyl-ACP methyl ester carboxylesterase